MHGRYKGLAASRRVRQDKARAFAERAFKQICRIMARGGVRTLAECAAALEEKGVPTPQRARWMPATVRRVLVANGYTAKTLYASIIKRRREKPPFTVEKKMAIFAHSQVTQASSAACKYLIVKYCQLIGEVDDFIKNLEHEFNFYFSHGFSEV